MESVQTIRVLEVSKKDLGPMVGVFISARFEVNGVEYISHHQGPLGFWGFPGRGKFSATDLKTIDAACDAAVKARGI